MMLLKKSDWDQAHAEIIANPDLERQLLDKAVYIAFGQAWGWMEMPPNSNNYVRINVHGAGCQRSDFKSGNPGDLTPKTKPSVIPARAGVRVRRSPTSESSVPRLVTPCGSENESGNA